MSADQVPDLRLCEWAIEDLNLYRGGCAVQTVIWRGHRRAIRRILSPVVQADRRARGGRCADVDDVVARSALDTSSSSSSDSLGERSSTRSR
jgi:hypothetical protein